MPEKTTFIWVTLQKEGWHRWPDAPNTVPFLRQPHRHMFHFRISISIEGNDREIEFIQCKWDIEYMLQKIWSQWNLGSADVACSTLSCEMIAGKLYEMIAHNYQGRDVVIEVSEDGENGCRIFYPWKKS